ncbi:MAG: molybdopterin-dependent oxidoreductase [Gammaproteobacteria bacterium]|nr:molybdopterin-dependent oxidoreductase [Gammaproteobacteria bacterium]
MSIDFGRRRFLWGVGAAGAALSLPSFSARAGGGLAALANAPAPAYVSWGDLYRAQWTWDKIVRGTHIVNCWYQSHCAWDVFVKDGIVFREEQAGEYPQVNAELPDFNPRGCNKGACYSDRMYDPARLKYPLKRVGPRGGGKWERVSWDQALSEIADKFLDVVIEEGTDRVIWDLGPNIDFGTTFAGIARFAQYTRGITLDMNTEIGDGHRGAAETFGKMVGDHSADDWFYSDLILVWGCNPIYTQIPQAHFLTEARYNGSRIIVIAPDFNASATKADLWVPVAPGTDAALALAVARLLIEEGKIDRRFVSEQTDLPLLVRTDTGHFLSEADLRVGGGHARHVLRDAAGGRLVAAPFASLELDGLEPELEVREQVRLADGTEVEVRSVYSLLRERLAPYTPEHAEAMCGTHPTVIRRLASEIAAAKAMCNLTTSNLNKYYHGNLSERSLILLFALTGNFGRKGAGYAAFPFLTIDGPDRFAVIPDANGWPQVEQRLRGLVEEKMAAGGTRETALYDITRMGFRPGNGLPMITCAALFWQVHGGIIDLAREEWDPFLKRSIQAYVDEALAKGWQPLIPEPGRPPRIMFSLTSNALRRIRGTQRVMETLWPELALSVVMDWRMNSTARFADYVLPAAGWYERTSHKWVTTLSPYYTMSTAAVPPLGESLPDWGIIALLAKHVQSRARERGIGTITNRYGEQVHLDRLYDDFTMNGEFTERDDEKVMRKLVELSTNLKNVSWEELKEKGFARYDSMGEHYMVLGNMTEIPPDDSITPYTFHVRDKVPWPTATRRIQFCLDHPLYMELDEVLPRHKEPPTIGGRYPLMLTAGHPRESIHASWRDSPLMMRLSRPEPFLLMSPGDAAERGLADGDWARVYNDCGGFEARIKVAPALRPAQTLIYHAWENYQFRMGSYRHVTPSPLNPVELAGGHPHLQPCYAWGQPSFFDRDTRIEVERVERAGAA